MIKKDQIEMLETPVYLHAEGPIWHNVRQSAFWVDILSNQIIEYNLDNKQVNVYSNAELVSAIFEIKGNENELIAIIKGGVSIYNLLNNTFDIINDLGIDWKEHRGNDGAIDPTGNIWLSSTHIEHVEGEGDVYRMNSFGSIEKVLEKISISNGPVWSPDGFIMYHTDSGSRLIKSYTNYQTIVKEFSQTIKVPDELGYPDGMAMDNNGILWVAIWGGFCVVGYDTKNGDLVGKIDLPVPNVSSCAFVGKKLDHLLITTSRKGLSEEELLKFPESGNVFLIKMDVSGVLMNTYHFEK